MATHSRMQRLGRTAGAATAALLLAALTGCEINKPEMPSFDTTLALPLGVERLEVLDAVDSEDYLAVLPDGGLAFNVTGDPDTVDFAYDLGFDVDPVTVGQTLGEFQLPAADPLDYGFALGEVWPASRAADGLNTPVPAFPIDVTSGAQDVPDVVSADLSAGTATVTLTNGLPVPVSAASGPDQVRIVLESAADGAFITDFVFGAVAPGATVQVARDLAGVTLPDGLRVRLTGGSPGSGGAVVAVDAADALDVRAELTGLVVTAAVAVVESQTLQTAFASDLPADYAVTGADIAAGSLDLDLTNSLPLDCTATIVWPDLLTTAGQPLRRVVSVPADGVANATVDFAGCRVEPTAGPLTSLGAEVTVVTAASGVPVAIGAGDAVSADLGGGRLDFDRVSGVVPEQSFPLTATETTIDLPDELTGLQMTAATLLLRIDTTAGLDGRFDLTLTGVSATGRTRTLAVSQEVPASYDQGLSTIVIDETNSDIVGFLNNLPERVSLDGQVSVGGDGAVGTVRPDDRVILSWEIAAPVSVVVTGATLSGDPETIDLDEDLRDRISTHAMGAVVEAEVLSHLPLGAQVTIAVGRDSVSVANDPLLVIGPLTVDAAATDESTGLVTAPVTSRPVVSLDTDEARIFGQPDLVTRVTAHLPDSGGRTATVLSTDYLEVRGVVRLDLRVDEDL